MLEEETMEKFSTAEPSENVSSSDRQSMDGDPLPDTVTAHDPVTAGERSEHDGGDPGGVPGTSYNTDSDGGEWADVLAAFCEVTGVKVDVLTEERRAKHLSSLRARARECNVKPGVLAHVIRQWPTSALSWRTWTDPASGIVKEDLAKLCEQHLSGGIKKAGGRGERNREIVREWLLPTGAVIDGDGGAWVSVDGVEIQQAAEVGR